MKLDRLILKNFITFDHLDYEFEKRPLLVQGENLTDDSQKTNGTGKSGLQTGIEFCITGNFSGYEQLITYGKESGSAELFASCDVRKEEIHIHWNIRLKGSNQLTVRIQKFDENQWSDVEFSNVNDGKAFVIKWFAISKEDISNYFIINNSRFKSFFKSSNKEKVDLINRFSDASIIEGLENLDNSELDLKYENANKIVIGKESNVNLLIEQIDKEKNIDFEEEMRDKLEVFEGDIDLVKYEIEGDLKNIETEDENILDFKEDISRYGDIIFNEESKREPIELEIKSTNIILVEIESSLKDAKIALVGLPATDWNSKRFEFENNLETDTKYLEIHKEKEIKLETQEGTILKFLQGIETKLAGAITCPKCDHEFSLDCDIALEKSKKSQGIELKSKIVKSISENIGKISQIKKIIDSINERIQGVNKLEQTENSTYNEFQQKINSVNEKLNGVKLTLVAHNIDLVNIDDEIKKLNFNIKSAESSVFECHSNITIHKANSKTRKLQIKVLEANIKILKVGNNDEHINTLQKDLKALELSLMNDKSKCESIGDEIYLQNQWKNNFKQFRLYLANKSLEIIEYHCNRYLTDMGSDLTVKMEGYKVLANGRVKEEITAKIIRDGNERTFNSFSGGERGRLLFASILANRQMINETHPYGGFDFLAVDEVFEGVDSLGLQSLIDSIKSLGITVLIVTHVSDDSENNDIITIVKENGVSRIKN